MGCSPWGREELNMTEQLHPHFSLSCIGEGNGNPIQCLCLENPRDGGAWWAAVCGVAQSRTRLKRLSSISSSTEHGFPGGSVVKNLPANAVDARDGFDPWVGKIPWRKEWKLTSVSLPGKTMDTGAWQATAQGVTRSWTRLSTARQHTAVLNTP